MMSSTYRALLITGLILYFFAVSFLDLLSPLGIEVWVLNLPVLLVPMLFRNRRLVVLASLACSVVVIMGSAISPAGGNPRWWDSTNRGMGLAAMWLMAGMAITTINRSNQRDAALRSLEREVAEHERTSQALQRSEERLRLAVEGAGMGTLDVNVKTGTAFWSATHLRMLGYDVDASGTTSVDLWRTCIHPDDLPRILEARDEALRNYSLYSMEYRIRRADNGKIIWLAVFGRWYYNEAGEGIRFLGVSFDITRRKELERQLLDISAQTQQHIGQELHDGVGQELTGLGLMAQTLSQRLPDAGPEQRLAVRLVAGLNQLHRQIRALARGLVPVEIEAKGLWAALDDLAASTSEQTGVSVRFECPEWVEMPDHATSMELYRISQEALSNALRHGRPTRIHITILSQPDGLRLRIRDDGVGIPDRPREGTGLGIRIMEYRAALIGAILRIKPGKDGGTVLTVTLPWRKPNDSKESRSTAGAGQDPDRG